MTSVGTQWTLAAGRGFAGAERAEHASLTAAHLVQAVAQVAALQQYRVLKTAPHLVKQVPVLTRSPQLADQVADSMHAPTPVAAPRT